MQARRNEIVAVALAALAGACQGGSTSDEPAPQTVAVEVSPASPRVATGGDITFAAAVTGTANTRVVWTVVEQGGGTVDASGQYTAPGTPGAYRVRATSAADPQAAGEAAVTVFLPVVVAVAPRTPSVTAGGTITFTASVANATDSTVTWSVPGTACGIRHPGRRLHRPHGREDVHGRRDEPGRPHQERHGDRHGDRRGPRRRDPRALGLRAGRLQDLDVHRDRHEHDESRGDLERAGGRRGRDDRRDGRLQRPGGRGDVPRGRHERRRPGEERDRDGDGDGEDPVGRREPADRLGRVGRHAAVHRHGHDDVRGLRRDRTLTSGALRERRADVARRSLRARIRPRDPRRTRRVPRAPLSPSRSPSIAGPSARGPRSPRAQSRARGPSARRRRRCRLPDRRRNPQIPVEAPAGAIRAAAADVRPRDERDTAPVEVPPLAAPVREPDREDALEPRRELRLAGERSVRLHEDRGAVDVEVRRSLSAGEPGEQEEWPGGSRGVSVHGGQAIASWSRHDRQAAAGE